MVGIEQAQGPVSGVPLVVALKSLNVHPRGVSLTQARRELYLAMGEVIVSDESPDEPDNHHGRHSTISHGSRLRKGSAGCSAAIPSWSDRTSGRRVDPATWRRSRRSASIPPAWFRCRY